MPKHKDEDVDDPFAEENPNEGEEQEEDYYDYECEGTIKMIAVGNVWGTELASWCYQDRQPQKVMAMLPRLYQAAPTKVDPGESIKLASGGDQIHCMLEGATGDKERPALVVAVGWAACWRALARTSAHT